VVSFFGYEIDVIGFAFWFSILFVIFFFGIQEALLWWEKRRLR